MSRLDDLRNHISSMEEDFMKFYDKGNSAAGTRVRKQLQGLKKLASEIRNEIQAKKSEGKASS